MVSDDDWSPGEKYQLYLSKIQEILGEGERSVRDIYYALEARGFGAEMARYGHDFAYRFVKRAVKLGRRHGYLDPGSFVDTSRPVVTTMRSSHDSPESFLKTMERNIKHGYFENYWADQPKYVEVWLEKASLNPVFRPICDEYNVRLEATRGDWSESKVYRATRRISDRVVDGKDVRVLYFGDFNPSGLHAPVSVLNRFRYYGLPLPWGDEDSKSPRYFEAWPWAGPFEWENADGSLKLERVSLTLDEIKRFDLPENPTPSSSDKDRTLRERFMQFASEGRDVNIELNALREYHRDYLENRIDEHIAKHIDEEAKEATKSRRDERQERIRSAIDVDYDVL